MKQSLLESPPPFSSMIFQPVQVSLFALTTAVPPWVQCGLGHEHIEPFCSAADLAIWETPGMYCSSFWITEQTQVRQLRPSNGVPKFFPQVQGLAAGVQTLGLVVVKCQVFWTGFIAILGEPVGGPHRNKTVSRFLSIFLNVSTCFYLFGDCPWACHNMLMLSMAFESRESRGFTGITKL